ncbi:MAG: STAS domain-containing protein [bacterium]
MEIAISPSEKDILAKITGAITESDSEAIKRAFEQLSASAHRVVKLDLSLVPTITSTGIGKIIILYKRLRQQNKELVIFGIHDNLYSMFVSINLDKMLTIQKNEQ